MLGPGIFYFFGLLEGSPMILCIDPQVCICCFLSFWKPPWQAQYRVPQAPVACTFPPMAAQKLFTPKFHMTSSIPRQDTHGFVRPDPPVSWALLALSTLFINALYHLPPDLYRITRISWKTCFQMQVFPCWVLSPNIALKCRQIQMLIYVMISTRFCLVQCNDEYVTTMKWYAVLKWLLWFL